MNSMRRIDLEAIKRIRDGIDEHRNFPFARHVHRIREQDFYALLLLFPGLNASDPWEKSAAWEAFDKSPLSEPYRVGRVVRGVTKNGDLIK